MKKSRLNESVKTIYFGGGTPSLLTKHELLQLIETIKTTFEIDVNLEISLEANPENCSEEKLEEFFRLGINRLSIGIQSFDNHQLAWMNRAHSSNESIKVIERLEKFYFDELSFDLIYGLPKQDMNAWKKEIQQILAFNPAHISAYCLTVEEKTPLAKWVKQKKILMPTQDLQSEQFEYLVKLLGENGYEQYEISNFARDKKYSKHNTAYWQGEKYLGIGPSAHEYDGQKRSWNVANNLVYIQEIENNIFPEEIEILSPKEKFNELLLTGLRTKWGVDFDVLSSVIEPSNAFYTKLENFENQHYIFRENGFLILTTKGKLLADHIASELFY